MTRPKIRCAIYTRKSSEEGLDQDFNSLDAQREACAAYIASQRHEGWKALPGQYNDGGISGGTLARPGLQRLLADIDARRVDMVVVYKIDRLTRSLADFAKLVERLENAGCSFVSVTQSFNTSSSMGRLTLNVLLSFAQFEREVTAERIRDKIAASKKKGLWMGGLPPLGYDPHPDKTRRELVVNDAEATTVRRLFDLYLSEGCLAGTSRAADAEGLCSKHRRFADGRQTGGRPFSRGQIHHLLTNPVYRGMIRHKDQEWPAQHPAIIDEATWDKVQSRLQQKARRKRSGDTPLGNGSAPLMGKLRDERGDLLTPTHTQRGDRIHRYYVSNRLISGGTDATGWRLPARALEAAVAAALSTHLDDLAAEHAMTSAEQISDRVAASDGCRDLATAIRSDGIVAAARLIDCGTIGRGSLSLTLDRNALANRLRVAASDIPDDALRATAPFTVRRRGVEQKIVTGKPLPMPDAHLIAALRKAHAWADRLKHSERLVTLAKTEGISERYAARIVTLATLSPGIQTAIVRGQQPVDLTLETLMRCRIPEDWGEQERLFISAT